MEKILVCKIMKIRICSSVSRKSCPGNGLQLGLLTFPDYGKFFRLDAFGLVLVQMYAVILNRSKFTMCDLKSRSLYPEGSTNSQKTTASDDEYFDLQKVCFKYV